MKVLIVDDIEGLQKLLHRIVSNMGHSVTCVSNVCKAIECLNDKSYDLLITDHNMSGKSGEELIIEAKEKIQIITIKLSGLPDNLENSKADYILAKPFFPHQLAEIIDRI